MIPERQGLQWDLNLDLCDIGAEGASVRFKPWPLWYPKALVTLKLLFYGVRLETLGKQDCLLLVSFDDGSNIWSLLLFFS